MKNTLIAATLATLAPLSAQADLLFTVGGQASVWSAEASGDIDHGLSVDNSGLNLGRESANQLSVFIEHPLPLLPNVKLRDTKLELSGNSQLDARFLGTQYDEKVHSQLDLSHTDLTLYWTLPIPLIDINLGMTTRQFTGDAVVSGELAGSRHVDLDFVLPMAYGEVKLDMPLGFYATAEGNYVSLAGNRMTDTSYAVGYNLPLPVPLLDIGVEAGYRSLSLQTDDDYADVNTDVKAEGMFFGASASLGF